MVRCASASSSRVGTSTFSWSRQRARTALRSLYQQGKDDRAVASSDLTGNALDIALAYGRAIGCARAGLIASSFAEEVADLFNEQAVVWGGVPELLIAGFDTLVAGESRPKSPISNASAS